MTPTKGETRLVNVVAHRGCSGRYPENTEVAFLKAIALGVDMIELDVRLSRDRALIVIHDATVDRTSDGTGRVGQMTRSEIKELDAGGWFAEEFEGLCFLTLDEALDLISGSARLNVELKVADSNRQELVSLAVDCLERRGISRSVFVASDQESIELARRIQPHLEICNLSKQPTDTYITRSLSIGCRILQPDNAQVDPKFVQQAHVHRMEVNPFYANDVREMRRLMRCNVDGILTDYPDVLLALRDEG